MQHVLDLDLDFFAAPVLHEVWENAPRPPDEGAHVWAPELVEALLQRLGLNEPVPGHAADRHVEALWAWSRAIQTGQLQPPFAVTHVDAHEDLGFGGPEWERLQEEVLTRPVWERRFEDLAPLAHSGNYLLLAVALGWIGELTLVLPETPIPAQAGRLHSLNVHDLHWMFGEPESGSLQLRSLAGVSGQEQARLPAEAAWSVLDPPVPVRVLGPEEVEPERWSFLTAARSPAFCPPKTDKVWPLLTRWMKGTEPS